MHQVDNKTINISNYDFPAYSQLATDILSKFKPCVDEYIEAVSILKPYKFLLFDMKIKKIPIGGGFHSWHFENGSIPYAQRKFVVNYILMMILRVVKQNFYIRIEGRYQDKVMY